MDLTIGRYEVRGEAGRGGMGAVLLGYDPVLKRKVAIKTVHAGGPIGSEMRGELEVRLFREAEAAAKLRHPGIVAIYDVLKVDSCGHIIMEFIEGQTLTGACAPHLQAPEPAVDPAFALRILRECAAALDHAHARNIVHRDIKPGNIMIDETGAVRITDFGIARILGGEALTKPGMALGTLEYMAPEQLRGQPVNGRADQFSLAVVGYRMLTGLALYSAKTMRSLCWEITTKPPPPAHVLNPKLPVAAGAILARALEKEAEGRYASCSAFVAALEGAFGEVADVGAKRRGPRRAALVAAVVSAVLLIAAVVFLMQKEKEIIVVIPVSGPPPAPAAGMTWLNPKDSQNYVWIVAGKFTMGCVSGDAACEEDEKPAHEVPISHGFWMGETEASVAAYRRFADGASGGEADHPVVKVKWGEAEAFCEWTGGRLPSEEEWEYAARGGKEFLRYPNGNTISAADANFAGSGSGATVPVLSYAPNGFGLYQMSGNVAEWTSGANGDKRMVRGGSFNVDVDGLRLSKRVAVDPDRRNLTFGMRCVHP